MELMTIKDGLDLVDKYKRIYEEEYRDIKLENGGVNIKNLNMNNMTLGLLEDNLELYRGMEGIEYSAIIIGHQPILKEYELLDSDTINLHLPVYKLKI